MTETANLVVRIPDLILIVAGVVIALAAGWARGLSPIAVGLALLVVDEATRRRGDGRTARA
jgi:hypothetical protein